jgi:hypothetical protein
VLTTSVTIEQEQEECKDALSLFQGQTGLFTAVSVLRQFPLILPVKVVSGQEVKKKV